MAELVIIGKVSDVKTLVSQTSGQTIGAKRSAFKKLEEEKIALLKVDRILKGKIGNDDIFVRFTESKTRTVPPRVTLKTNENVLLFLVLSAEKDTYYMITPFYGKSEPNQDIIDDILTLLPLKDAQNMSIPVQIQNPSNSSIEKIFSSKAGLIVFGKVSDVKDITELDNKIRLKRLDRNMLALFKVYKVLKGEINMETILVKFKLPASGIKTIPPAPSLQNGEEVTLYLNFIGEPNYFEMAEPYKSSPILTSTDNNKKLETPPVTAVNLEGFVVKITSDKPVYKTGESINVRVEFENNGATPLLLQSQFPISKMLKVVTEDKKLINPLPIKNDYSNIASSQEEYIKLFPGYFLGKSIKLNDYYPLLSPNKYIITLLPFYGETSGNFELSQSNNAKITIEIVK